MPLGREPDIIDPAVFGGDGALHQAFLLQDGDFLADGGIGLVQLPGQLAYGNAGLLGFALAIVPDQQYQAEKGLP